jgi:lipoprotein-anchoring transpeptidase ErfK/SrfK
MKVRGSTRFLIVLLTALVFVALGASSAFATDPTLPLTFTSGGLSFTAPSSLISSGSVDTTAVNNWVSSIASKVNCKASNATLKLNKKKKRLDFTASKIGYTLDRSGAATVITAQLASYISTPTTTTVALPTAASNPKITKFGKTILVVQSQRKIYLYNNDKVMKTYRCAVGQKSWPTPNGTFYIGKKVKNPSWTNGYASWSKNMPAYIGPGPNNPLGTRAMYVYNSKGKDTGVRFHGVPPSEDSSIGHAASHGCLRMHRRDVEKFFPLVPLGTVVYIIK